MLEDEKFEEENLLSNKLATWVEGRKRLGALFSTLKCVCSPECCKMYTPRTRGQIRKSQDVQGGCRIAGCQKDATSHGIPKVYQCAMNDQTPRWECSPKFAKIVMNDQNSREKWSPKCLKHSRHEEKNHGRGGVRDVSKSVEIITFKFPHKSLMIDIRVRSETRSDQSSSTLLCFWK